jgi:outer membrane protein assembly factor BamB
MGKWRWLTAAGISGMLLASMMGAASASGQAYVNWPRYLYSNGHSSDNTAAAAITPANAANLSLAWKFVPPGAPIKGLGGFLSSPTVYDGVIYIGARNGYFYALSESTGTVIWSVFVGYVTHKTCGAQGFASTATVAPDPTSGEPTVYVYGPDGYLYAFNAADGTVLWKALVAVPSTTKNDYYAWDSPLLLDGNVYVGISSQCDIPLVRAGLDEFSQATGASEGTFWTTPANTRGASIWSSPATDGKSVYITTGNGTQSSDGESIIRLSPSMAEQGIWTVPVSEQIKDGDFGASPGIWRAVVGGKVLELVGACNKNGTFYALNAATLTAGPVWQDTIGNPYPQGPGECDAAPVWDGSTLYLSSDGTTINGTAYAGSVRAVNPATGAIIWQTGLTGPPIGTPGMDGAGVIAAQTYGPGTSTNGIFLINAASGTILKTISYGASEIFAQPVFADQYLFVASQGMGLRAYTAGTGG